MYVVETVFNDSDECIPICYKKKKNALKRAKSEIQRQFRWRLNDYGEYQISIENYPQTHDDPIKVGGYSITYRDLVGRQMIVDFAVVKHFEVK